MEQFKKTSLILLLLWSILLQAQPNSTPFKVLEGQPFKLESNEIIVGFLEQRKDTLILITAEPQNNNRPLGFSLQYFDVNTLKWTGKESIKRKMNNGEFLKLTYIAGFNSGVYAFGAAQDKRVLKNDFYAFKVKDSSESVLASIEMYTNDRPGDFLLAQSPDNQLVSIFSSKPFEKLGSNNLDFIIITDELSILKTISIPLRYHPKDYDVSDLKIANDSTIYLLLQYAKGIQKNKEKLPAEKYLLLQIEPDGKTVKELEIGFNDKTITTVKMMQRLNEITLLGLYSSAKQVEGSSGYFFMRLNKETGSLQRHMNNFDQGFINYIKARKQDELNGEAAYLNIKEILQVENDEFIALLESYHQKEICYTDPRTGVVTCNTHHFCNDVFLMRFNELGAPLSWQVLPKTQYTFNEFQQFLSTTIVNTKPPTVIFNDHIKNNNQLSTGELKPMDRTNKAAPFFFTFMADGQVVGRSQFKSETESDWLWLPETKFVNENFIYLLGSNKNQYQLLKIIPD